MSTRDSEPSEKISLRQAKIDTSDLNLGVQELGQLFRDCNKCIDMQLSIGMRLRRLALSGQAVLSQELS